MKHTKNALIENEFVYKAHYSLSTVEQKIVLFLVSRINPKEDEEFSEQIVSIREIENLLSKESSKWGSAYEYLQSVSKNLLKQQIFFTQPVIVKGKERIIGGGINWFQHILITQNDQGEKSIEFKFSDMMKPFLLELNRYVRINTLEIMNMKGKYSIRLYQMFKAERERTKKYKKVSSICFALDELKSILGIADKYKYIKDFKNRVLEPTKDEINEYSEEISIDYEYVKTGRKVTAISFSIWDKEPVSSIPVGDIAAYTPSVEEIESLSNAKYLAYQLLVDYGVMEGIAYKQIIPRILGGEAEGYEDLFVKHFLLHFDIWTNQKNQKGKAGAFVKWFLDKDVFSLDGDVYWKVNEKVYQQKKSMTEEQKENRQLAKNLTRAAFFEKVTKDK